MPIDPERTKILACHTVMEEMLPLLPASIDYEILDFGLHANPDKLRLALQEAIDAVSAPLDTILLGFGLCSKSVVGLCSESCRLVVPRIDDCIGIFFGSQAAFRREHFSEPGTYYLTKGWIETSDPPFGDWEPMIKRYGLEKTEYLMRLMLKDYTRMVLINTGQYEIERYRDYARRLAENHGLRYEELPGSNALVKKLLYGPWDDEFIVTRPGEAITWEHFQEMLTAT